MCGVVGISLVPGAAIMTGADQLARIGLQRLLHRGPDGHGVAGDRLSAVAMCRLRVRSQPSDQVPFSRTSEHLGTPEFFAYNGEVYTDGVGRIPKGGLDEAVAVAGDSNSQPDGMYALVHRTMDGSIHVARDPTPALLGVSALPGHCGSRVPCVR